MPELKRFVTALGAMGLGAGLFTEVVAVAQQSEKSGPALVCTLTSPELQQRRAGIIKRLRESAQAQKELLDGWSFQFADRQFDELVEFVKLERKCCAFFKFSLTLEPNNGPVWLSITGPAAAKAMIAEELKPVSR